MAVDFVEMVSKELRVWLVQELAAEFPTLRVLDSFPAPGRTLSLPAVAIQTVGDPDVEPHSAMAHASTPTTGAMGLVTYSYGRVAQDMQLDVWGSNPRERNALMRAVSNAVNTHPIYSLPIAGALPEFRRYPGVARRVADLAGSVVSYHFSQVTAPEEGGDAAQTAEYRAVFVGEARFHAVSQESMALLKRITLDWTVNGASETRTR